MNDLKRFLCSYHHDDCEWSLTLHAYDMQDANERCKKLGWLRLDGELMFRVPVCFKALAEFICSTANIMRALVAFCCLASCTTTTPTVKECLTVSHAPVAASCVAIDADLLDEPGPMDALRLWGHRSKFWPQDAVLKVRFLDGSTFQQERAWQRFQAIDELAGITFERVCSGPSDIRVAFRAGSGHWSFLGTDTRSIPQHAATMNLGLTTQDDSGEWDRVALHEILHALGFSHELQHPRASIPWDERRVIADYAATQGWSEDQTRRQVLTRDEGADFVGSTFDAASIMCYPVERSHVTNPAYAVGWNRRLTDTDKRIIKEVYPTSL